MNKVYLIGRAARDAQTRTVNGSNGQMTVCSFTLMVNRTAKRDSAADAFRVSLWGKYGETMAQYIKKGTQLAVTGSVYVSDPYQANDGTYRSSLEVNAQDIELLSRPKTETATVAAPNYDAPVTEKAAYSEIGSEDVIPF